MFALVDDPNEWVRPVSANAQQFKLEIVSANGQTLLRLHYGYAFSSTARWVMQVYLATLGRDRMRFHLAGH